MFTAGGDGTVLQAALSVQTSNTPVITVNTDPCFSAGQLCSLEIKQDAPETFGRALDLLKANKFEWLVRKRLAISTVAPVTRGAGVGGRDASAAGERSKVTMPGYPLNEVFFSERDASRPSVSDRVTD
jgi:NAD kinase